jgi:hypothetical protein
VWEKLDDLCAEASATTGNSENRSDSSTNNDTLNIATVVQQIIIELSEAVSEKDKIMVITKPVRKLKTKLRGL